MVYYAELNSQNQILGYYIEDFHGIEKCQSLDSSILVDEDLHSYLVSLGFAELTTTPEGKTYTMEDKDIFREVIPEEVPLPPSMDERLAALEEVMMGVL